MSVAVADAAQTVSNATNAVERNNVALHKNMIQSELYTNAGYLALNIWDRFDVFCTLGTTNAYIKGSSSAFNLIGLIGLASDPGNSTPTSKTRPNANITNAFVELYTDAEFSWSIGSRGALWECGCATLGTEFQYAQAKPQVSQINVVSNVAQFSIDHPKGFVGDLAKLPLPYGQTTKAPDLTKAKTVSANYNEWQVGLALAYRLNFISPYIGIKWARAKVDFDGAYITQPQLAETGEKLDMQTWNPTLVGTEDPGSANTDAVDVLTQVSVTLNKLKSKELASLLKIEKLLIYRLFCKKSLSS